MNLPEEFQYIVKNGTSINSEIVLLIANLSFKDIIIIKKVLIRWM